MGSKEFITKLYSIGFHFYFDHFYICVGDDMMIVQLTHSDYPIDFDDTQIEIVSRYGRGYTNSFDEAWDTINTLLNYLKSWQQR